MAPADPKPPEPGSPEDLGLDRNDDAATPEQEAENIEEEGEPFDGNFA